MLRICIFIVLFLVVGTSAPVFAQDGQKQMEDSVVLAHQAFGEGRFLEAAEGYAEAFRFYKDYTLKKNEMVAWFKNGSCSPALEAADLYLENGEDITESDRIDMKAIRVRCELVSAKKSLNLGNVDSCESHLNKAEEIISADALPPVQGSDEYREILRIRVEIEILKKGSESDSKPIPTQSSSYLGPIIVGAGTAVGVTGLVLILSSLGAETDLQCTKNVADPSCTPSNEIERDDYNSQLDKIQTLNTIGWVGALVGVTTIGIGSVLWLSEGTDLSASIDPVNGRVSTSFVTHF